MKKALLFFFVLIAAVGACFATQEQIILSTTINPTIPTYKLSGFLGTAGVATDADATFPIGSPADSDIVLTVAIRQSNDARFKGARELTITATPIACVDDGMTAQTTALPSIGDFTPSGKENVSASKTIDAAAGKVTIDLNYAGTLVNGYNIASWVYTWTAVPSLAPGNYQGTVTLEYSAN